MPTEAERREWVRQGYCYNVGPPRVEDMVTRKIDGLFAIINHEDTTAEQIARIKKECRGLTSVELIELGHRLLESAASKLKSGV